MSHADALWPIAIPNKLGPLPNSGNSGNFRISQGES
jgi:hypothetical protein